MYLQAQPQGALVWKPPRLPLPCEFLTASHVTSPRRALCTFATLKYEPLASCVDHPQGAPTIQKTLHTTAPIIPCDASHCPCTPACTAPRCSPYGPRHNYSCMRHHVAAACACRPHAAFVYHLSYQYHQHHTHARVPSHACILYLMGRSSAGAAAVAAPRAAASASCFLRGSLGSLLSPPRPPPRRMGRLWWCAIETGKG